VSYGASPPVASSAASLNGNSSTIDVAGARGVADIEDACKSGVEVGTGDVEDLVVLGVL
jgi:hypothetical protein